MQLVMDFDEKGLNTPQSLNKKKMAMKQGLLHFFDGENIDIKKAYEDGYVDELKGFLTTMLGNLKKYETLYREEYKKELNVAIDIFGLGYFSQKDMEPLERFL